MNVMDAHQHYWRVSRGDYGWLTPELGPLYQDYLPEDLGPHLSQYEISKTIVVQAAPTVEETKFLLQLADSHSSIAGVVGWLDFESPEFDEAFTSLRKHPKLVGIRPMLQDIEDDAWILRPAVLQSVERLVAEDFPLDILVFPRHLPYIAELLNQFPTLRAVVNHLAKPPIRTGVTEPWRDSITKVAAHSGVMCKLSGMVTEADHRNWKPADLKPYVEHVVQIFGTNRVMFGSDWPVCTLAADYGQVLNALREVLPVWITPAEMEDIFCRNAARFYRV